MNHAFRSVIYGLAVLLVILVACFLIFLDDETDKTDSWADFYKETVSNYFVLPNSLIIKEAKIYTSAIMGMNFTVTFYLDNDLSPEDWIDKIAGDSKMPRKYKVNSLMYDCFDECDIYKLYYDNKRKLYVIEAGWD